MKKIVIMTALCCLCTGLRAQVIFKNPLSPRNASYNIQVTLDTERKQIHGRQILLWKNITAAPAHELQFHLYMNAFKNSLSTMSRETGSWKELRDHHGWGWIAVHSLTMNGGQSLLPSSFMIQPDDQNRDDETVLCVPLPRAVRPGETVSLAMEFTVQLPFLTRRSGYRKDFVFAAQWFPKIGVFENGHWNCHQYHANSEFFADFGVYSVEITLPSKMIVGATGILQRCELKDSVKTVTFRAEDVHDFVWTAWPHFLSVTEHYRGIDITVLHEKDHVSSVRRTFSAVEHAIDFFSEWAGPYPYPNLTVLHPPTGCMNAGGMEYPTFITGMTFWNIPAGIRLPEMVTIHEFGHNYWYGMVGNNEFEEAWLDEGINTYYEYMIMNRYYGKDHSMIDLGGIRFGEEENIRSTYIGRPRGDRILRPAWSYIGGGYATYSYNKPCLMLITLENMIGTPVMQRVMRTYFQRWRFKHPKSQDFIDVANEVSGIDLSAFFDQFLKNSFELDYAVASVYAERCRAPEGEWGWHDMTYPVRKENTTATDQEPDSLKSPDMFRSVVKVQRRGEAVLPVDILLVFADGDSVKEVWDGRDRWLRIEHTRPARLVSAEVDPDRKCVLDSNFTNNSRTVKKINTPVHYAAIRLLNLVQTMLAGLGFLA